MKESNYNDRWVPNGHDDEKIHVEYYITLRCNLNCLACSSFSPLVPDAPFISLDYIKADFEKKLYKLTDNGKKIGVLVLMGGEPLLHPHINYIMKYFLELGIHLRIVTNGILVPKMNQEWFDMMRDYNVELCVSIYKILKYEKVFKKLHENKIPYFLYDQKGCFGHQYLHNERKPDITHCWYRANIYILKDNVIYPCSETAHLDVFDEKFKGRHNLKLREGDWIDLDEVETYEQLREIRRTTTPPLCYHCDGSEKPKTDWRTSDGSLEEWLNLTSN